MTQNRRRFIATAATVAASPALPALADATPNPHPCPLCRGSGGFQKGEPRGDRPATITEIPWSVWNEASRITAAHHDGGRGYDALHLQMMHATSEAERLMSENPDDPWRQEVFELMAARESVQSFNDTLVEQIIPDPPGAVRHMTQTRDEWTPEKAELHRVAVGIHTHEAYHRGVEELPEFSPVKKLVLYEASRSWIWSYEPTHEAARAALDGYKQGRIIPDVPSLPPCG